MFTVAESATELASESATVTATDTTEETAVAIGRASESNDDQSTNIKEYSVESAAVYLRIGTRSVKELIRIGVLMARDQSTPSQRVRRRRQWVIDGDSLRSYAANRKLIGATTKAVVQNVGTREVFTSGQIAQLCHVAPRTVSKWFDAGILKGYRIPGSKDRRVPRANLIAFLTEYNFPLGELEQHNSVLLVGCTDTLHAAIYPLLGARPVLHAPDWLAAGLLIERYHPAVIVADMASGRGACLAAARALRGSSGKGKFSDVRLVGLATADEVNTDELRAAGWDVVTWELTARVEEVAKVVLGCVGV